jgi:hypothetical protein
VGSYCLILLVVACAGAGCSRPKPAGKPDPAPADGEPATAPVNPNPDGPVIAPSGPDDERAAPPAPAPADGAPAPVPVDPNPVGPVKPPPVPADERDVDALASLFSVDHFVGRRENRRCVPLKDEAQFNAAMLRTAEDAEHYFDWPDDREWVEAVKKLRASRVAAVAATIAAAKEPLDIRSQLTAITIKVKAEQSARLEMAVAQGGTLFTDLGRWAGDDELRDAVRLHQLSEEAANEYRRARADAQSREFIGWNAVFTSAVQGLKLDGILRRGHRRAEVLECDVFKTHLLPTLKARAGATVERAPVELSFGALTNEDVVTGYSLSAFVSARSRSEQPLTRLTLVVELPSRSACVYIPKLQPNEPFRLAPFLIDVTRDIGAGAKAPRYSIYCDQFGIEDRPFATGGSALFDYGVQALLVDSEYVCRPIPRAGRLPKAGAQPVYRLTFNNLQPMDNGYRFTARLNQYDAEDTPAVTASFAYTGALRPAPARNGRAFGLLCELTGPGGPMRAVLSVERDGTLVWNRGEGGPLQDVDLVSATLVREAEERREKRKVIDQATHLAYEGKKEEVRKMLNDFIASRPGRQLEHQAREALRNVDFWAATGVIRKAKQLAHEGKMEEARKMLNDLIASRPGSGLDREAADVLSNLDFWARYGPQGPPWRR